MLKRLRRLAMTLTLIACVSSVPAQMPGGGPGGGGPGGGPPGGGGFSPNWEVMASERNGVTELFGWTYGPNGIESTYSSLSWNSNLQGFASNGTYENLSATAHSHGTIKLKLKYIGAGTAPANVWVRVDSSASYGALAIYGEDENVTGDASNGIGHPHVEDYAGGSSSGHDVFKLSVGGGGIAEKTITLNAIGTVTGPQKSIGAGCGASLAPPGDLSFRIRKMEFTTTLGSIINQTATFGSTSGSAYPYKGYYQDDNNVANAYPVHLKRGQSYAVDLLHKVWTPAYNPTKAVGYKIFGSAFQNFFAEQSFTASDSYQTGNFTGSSAIANKVHKFTYDVGWQMSPEPVYGGGSANAGAGTALVAYEAPMDSPVTFKRLNWAVTVANNATTKELVADGVWAGLGGNPPLEPAPNRTPLGISEDEWKLLDGVLSGECDEQARLMRRGIRLLGVDGSVQFVRASSNVNVMDLESRPSQYIAGKTDYLIYYHPGPNAFEATCVVQTGAGGTGEHWYAVWPQIKRESALEILRALILQGAVQRWVTLENGYVPGDNNGWANHILYLGATVGSP